MKMTFNFERFELFWIKVLILFGALVLGGITHQLKGQTIKIANLSPVYYKTTGTPAVNIAIKKISDSKARIEIEVRDGRKGDESPILEKKVMSFDKGSISNQYQIDWSKYPGVDSFSVKIVGAEAGFGGIIPPRKIAGKESKEWSMRAKTTFGKSLFVGIKKPEPEKIVTEPTSIPSRIQEVQGTDTEPAPKKQQTSVEDAWSTATPENTTEPDVPNIESSQEDAWGTTPVELKTTTEIVVPESKAEKVETVTTPTIPSAAPAPSGIEVGKWYTPDEWQKAGYDTKYPYAKPFIWDSELKVDAPLPLTEPWSAEIFIRQKDELREKELSYSGSSYQINRSTEFVEELELLEEHEEIDWSLYVVEAVTIQKGEEVHSIWASGKGTYLIMLSEIGKPGSAYELANNEEIAVLEGLVDTTASTDTATTKVESPTIYEQLDTSLTKPITPEEVALAKVKAEIKVDTTLLSSWADTLGYDLLQKGSKVKYEKGILYYKDGSIEITYTPPSDEKYILRWVTQGTDGKWYQIHNGTSIPGKVLQKVSSKTIYFVFDLKERLKENKWQPATWIGYQQINITPKPGEFMIDGSRLEEKTKNLSKPKFERRN